MIDDVEIIIFNSLTKSHAIRRDLITDIKIDIEKLWMLVYHVDGRCLIVKYEDKDQLSINYEKSMKLWLCFDLDSGINIGRRPDLPKLELIDSNVSPLLKDNK